MLLVPLCIGRGEVVAVSAADDGVLALERLLAACSSLESALTLGRRRLKVTLDVERLARSSCGGACPLCDRSMLRGRLDFWPPCC